MNAQLHGVQLVRRGFIALLFPLPTGYVLGVVPVLPIIYYGTVKCIFFVFIYIFIYFVCLFLSHL